MNFDSRDLKLQAYDYEMVVLNIHHNRSAIHKRRPPSEYLPRVILKDIMWTMLGIIY